MTNKEFYGDKMLAITLEGVCGKLHKTAYGKSCAGKQCEDCGFNDIEDIENWLNAEHVELEPPLLENGDDLKPGDWIMVRNNVCGPWEKRQFMCYFQSIDKSYITLEEMAGWYLGKHECWKYARLPMEGE